MKSKALASFLILLLSSHAMACKERSELDEYPIYDIQESDVFVELEIQTVEKSKDEWTPPITSFKATVLNAYKGNISVGETITVEISNEDPRAVCPIRLKVNEKYLFLLSKKGEHLEASRFDYLVSSSHSKYVEYKKQIESIFKK